MRQIVDGVQHPEFAVAGLQTRPPSRLTRVHRNGKSGYKLYKGRIMAGAVFAREKTGRLPGGFFWLAVGSGHCQHG